MVSEETNGDALCALLVGFCTAKVKGLNYNRWLDQRVDWVGLAPADASNGTSRNDQSKRAYGASGT